MKNINSFKSYEINDNCDNISGGRGLTFWSAMYELGGMILTSFEIAAQPMLDGLGGSGRLEG